MGRLLQQEVIYLGEEHHNRFHIDAALSLLNRLTGAGRRPIMAMEMFGWEPISMRASTWAQLALASPVVLWGGWPFFERFWSSLRSRNLNMFTLIGLGVGVAYGYSLVATLAPQIFPDSLRTMGGAVPVYFEAAAVITTLVLLGLVLVLNLGAVLLRNRLRRKFRTGVFG